MNVECEQQGSVSQVTITGPSNDTSQLSLATLFVDCLEELFVWLSCADLFALRRKCKRLKTTVDYYIKVNYPKIGKAKINDQRFQRLHQMDGDSIGLIKDISFKTETILDASQLAKIKEILGKVQRIILDRSHITAEFYDCFLKHCSNLRGLYIGDKGGAAANANVVIGTDNSWLLREYPSLESIQMYGAIEVPELKTFFCLNPNMRFQTDVKFLETNRHLLSDAQVDQLLMCYVIVDIGSIIDLFGELYRHGFYKRLSIYALFRLHVQNDINQLALIPALHTLWFFDHDKGRILPSMPHLKYVVIGLVDESEVFESCAKNNVGNIERLRMLEGSIVKIASFLRHFPKLKHIDVFRFVNRETYFDGDVIDLQALNKERKKLENACKVTLYVQEDIYLATKWATMKTAFDSIELKRSIETQH
ncbi:uncharacterized protein LOC129570780 [Sitodiplosis mosellana]|uniref:uncharacterized protein LOC129570780 n=1 Tax=Sitodiplosis mosellana TaxID=263140 RepID=UPI002444D049|nr:uncharacterized protein LOC129570780 [Sitodiplosis mosellana]